MIKSYLEYFWKAKDEHGLHSPFVFELYTQIIKKSEEEYYAYAEIEQLRENLLNSTETIVVQDFGAGSKVNKTPERAVKDIAKNATKNAQIGQLLFRLVNRFQPKTIIDLGTCLGITTAYLASPVPKSTIYTFEGSESLIQLAQTHFKMLGLSNIKTVLGNIDDTLPATLDTFDKIDFAFIDANHRYEPTIRYFEQILDKSHEDTVIILDDIYWSDEMKRAWQNVVSHPQVMISIDLFWIGIVFLRKKQPKQHFTLKF
ncbi:SAM-dependent methyltransferase [bacterium 336/3]|nr:SAM-dependent methyltransferase [bacterium 336/3]